MIMGERKTLKLYFRWRKYDDLAVDEETNDYHVQFSGMYDGSLFSFRILAVNDQLKVVANTAEVRAQLYCAIFQRFYTN